MICNGPQLAGNIPRTYTTYSPCQLDDYMLHSGNLTWNLKGSPQKRKFLLETIIFRFHVKFRGSTYTPPIIREPGYHSIDCCFMETGNLPLQDPLGSNNSLPETWDLMICFWVKYLGTFFVLNPKIFFLFLEVNIFGSLDYFGIFLTMNMLNISISN